MHVITHLWANFGKQKIGDKRWTQHPVMMIEKCQKHLFYRWKTRGWRRPRPSPSPCVRLLKHVCAWCWDDETERETETDREDRDRERREDQREGDKTREDAFSVWWCMAVFCWWSAFSRARLEPAKQCQGRLFFDFFQCILAGWQFFKFLRNIYSMQLQFSILFLNYSLLQLQFQICRII